MLAINLVEPILKQNKKNGMSNDDFMENALQLYDTENGGNEFLYMHVWLKLKNQPKWQVLNKAKKGSSSTKRVKESKSEGYYLLVGEDVEEVHPLGQKASKRNEAEKRKGKDVNSRYIESSSYLKDIEVERLQGQG